MTTYIPSHVLTAKRAMDITVALIGLFICALITPFIASAIYISSPGPILFKQLRIGRATGTMTEIFWMYKFRTMHLNAEAKTGAVWAQKNDPRITSIGLILRKTRLDELPQLYNVLRGEMSLIGPRPERPGFYQKLENAIPYFAERTWGLKPGITGLAQINQGYDRDIEDVRSKVAFDHAYALYLGSFLSWLRSDSEIILKTILVMICGRGQ